MCLILSTALHSLAIYPVIASQRNNRAIYSSIILLSTALSILWHFYKEEQSPLLYLNYGMGAIWTIYDIMLINQTEQDVVSQIFILTWSIYCLNGILSLQQNYELTHSLWHILSSTKCLYVSYLLFHS